MIRRFSTGIGGCLAALLLPPTAAGQRDTTRADSAAALPELVVRSTRPVTTIGGASGIRARLDSLAVPAAPTLERVLQTLPMLHLRRNSRGEAELSVRGSDSRQVAVLVDGIPLTLAWDGRVDASVIPATAPRNIDFVRGLSSMLHGPNVLGGVVEIGVGQSLLQPQSPSAELAAEADHVGGVGTKASVTLPYEPASGRWLVRAGLGFRDSPGQPLARGIAEPVSSNEDLRLNTDAESVDGFGSVRFHSNSGAWFSVSGSTFRAERGIAAELGIAEPRFWRYPHVSRSVVVASAGTGQRPSPLGGHGDVEMSLGLDLGRTDIDAYTSRSYSVLDGFERGRDRTLTLRALADQSLGGRGEFRGAFTLAEVRHDESVPEGDARYRQRLYSVGGETVWRVVEEGQGGVSWLRLSAGGAWDVAETPESGGREPLGRLSEWGARLGATMGLADGNTLIHGGLSRRARFPSLRELYSGALNRFAPNPDLRPENLVVMEAGVTTRLGRADLQAVAFRQQMNDAVVRVTLPDRRFMRVNRNRLTSAGLELAVSSTFGHVALGADLTAQSVRLTDTEAGVTNRPENLPEIFGGVNTAFPLALGVRATAEARFTGSQYCLDPDSGADRRLDAGTVINGGLSRIWRVRRDAGGLLGRLETRLSVDNAGDVALYDQCGLPQPGRMVRLQVRVF